MKHRYTVTHTEADAFVTSLDIYSNEGMPLRALYTEMLKYIKETNTKATFILDQKDVVVNSRDLQTIHLRLAKGYSFEIKTTLNR